MYAHNKHLLRATLIVSALMPATLAAAADLPLPPRAPAWSWSGFYLGGSAGAGGGHRNILRSGRTFGIR
ncbi:MAG: hypothetical protein ACXWJ8_08870 [Xanthobacteraceae bacterium]|jgi:opacity protein-like surface antigen